MSATVSYDVFDTVVTRAFAHPRDVFVHLGAVLGARGVHRGDALAFARARWAAEVAAHRRSPEAAVVFDDIYVVLAEELGWDEATRRSAQALELEIESRHLHGIPAMRLELTAARSGAGRLVFLSDMYLPSAVLRAWLEREQVMQPGDVLLVSGEAKASKSSGRLFESARRETDVEFARWRHAGDHAFADLQKPRELGIAATHRTQAWLTAREKTARGTDGEFALPWRSLLAGAMRLARLEHTFASERESVLWETGATLAGPLFHGFVRWSLEEAERRGLHRLYFLARDGQIFWRIARELQAAGIAPGVECHYLYASRLAFAGAAEIEEPAALRELAESAGHFHSLRQTLAHLGLDRAPVAARLPDRFRNVDPDANLPVGDRAALADWLLAPAQRGDLQAAVQQRAAGARAYLASVGLRVGEPAGLVDTGWLGSIQRNLERILGDSGVPSPLTGFYLGLMPPRPPLAAGEMLGYTNRFNSVPLMREESHKVLLELMAQSDHGQVTGFILREGRWAPVFGDPGPVNLAEIRLFQDAVLAFNRRLLETGATAAPPEADFARTVIGLYKDFHDRPAAREARLWGFLPHADQLLEMRRASLCADLSLGAVLAALVDYRRRPPHWWIGGQAALGHALPLRTFRWLKKEWRRLSGRTA